MDKINVIYDDFKTAVTTYIENFSEKSRTEAAEIGMILMALGKIPSSSSHKFPISFHDFPPLIEDELEAAEKYAAFYQRHPDESLRQLSKQELSHALYWIEKAQGVAKTPDCHARLTNYKRRYEDILESLG